MSWEMSDVCDSIITTFSQLAVITLAKTRLISRLGGGNNVLGETLPRNCAGKSMPCQCQNVFYVSLLFHCICFSECKDSVKNRFSEGKENIFSFLSVRFLGLPMKPISWEATQKPILCIVYIHCNEQ